MRDLLANRNRGGPFWVVLTFFILFFTGSPVSGQVVGGYSAYDEAAFDASVISEDEEPVDFFTDDELDELVGSVALYPDDLLAIVLQAASYPVQVVLATRFLDAAAEDDTLVPDDNWHDSIVALLNYPDVLRQMNENLDWTAELGYAVTYQEPDVLAAIERFRQLAYATGNLSSDEYQVVQYSAGSIEVLPVDPQVIYVPVYEPERVVTYQAANVYRYYSDPRPVYYYPYPAGYRFRSGYFWGVTSVFRLNLHMRHLRVHHHNHNAHPFRGHSYGGHYYRSPGSRLAGHFNWMNRSHANRQDRHSARHESRERHTQSQRRQAEDAAKALRQVTRHREDVSNRGNQQRHSRQASSAAIAQRITRSRDESAPQATVRSQRDTRVQPGARATNTSVQAGRNAPAARRSAGRPDSSPSRVVSTSDDRGRQARSSVSSLSRRTTPALPSQGPSRNRTTPPPNARPANTRGQQQRIAATNTAGPSRSVAATNSSRQAARNQTASVTETRNETTRTTRKSATTAERRTVSGNRVSRTNLQRH